MHTEAVADPVITLETTQKALPGQTPDSQVVTQRGLSAPVNRKQKLPLGQLPCTVASPGAPPPEQDCPKFAAPQPNSE